MNRRHFLMTSASTAAAVSSRLRAASVPSETVRIAVVGFHGRGKDHIKGWAPLPNVEIVALCDVDEAVLNSGVDMVEKLGKKKPAAYTDLRKLLEDKSIDAISIATPNHQHTLQTIWACQAGKDVYVEKPCSHNMFEAKQIVAAARKYDRMVQQGSQSRSSVALREAVQKMNEGVIGDLYLARGLCYKWRDTIGHTPISEVPAGVDYDLWLGPAPKTPFTKNHFHYNWHWFWAYGNGDLGNQGIHQMDIARWTLGEPEISPRVISIGGRLGYDDDGLTPNTQIVFHDYKAAPLIFEVRGLPAASDSTKMDEYHGASIGVVVDCEGGSIVIPSYTKAIVHDKAGKEIKTYEEGGDHFANFIEAVRSRKHTDLHADIAEGHTSAALVHTGNISYRLGKPSAPEAIRAAAKGDRDLAESLGRMEEHLGANQVDLHQTHLTLGAVLKMNPKTERFTNNSAANKLLTREYRRPFAVPEKV